MSASNDVEIIIFCYYDFTYLSTNKKNTTFDSMSSFTFPIEEKLKSKKIIDALFQNKGITGFAYPIKAVYNIEKAIENQIACPAIAVTVPKKKFKSAVSRNKLKRRIKEAYRLNSGQIKSFCTNNNIFIPIVFIYIATDFEEYQKIESSIKKILKNIIKDYGTGTD